MIDWNDDDISSGEITFESEDSGQEPEKEQKKNFFEESDSSDEEGKRVVMSAIDKLKEDFQKIITKLESSLKTEDYGTIGDDWEILVNVIRKSKTLSEKSWYPAILLQFLVNLEDRIKAIDKTVQKQMKTKQAHNFNVAQRQFKKFLKENTTFVDVLNQFRDTPEKFHESTKDLSESLSESEDEGIVWNDERIISKLQQLLKERGRKTYATKLIHEHINLFRTLLSKAVSLSLQVLIRFRIINAMFDTNLGTHHLNINTWKNIYNQIVSIITTLLDSRELQLDEDTLEEDTKLPPNVVGGHLLFSIQKLHEEYLRSLQNIDSHTPEYLTRLSHERDFFTALAICWKIL